MEISMLIEGEKDMDENFIGKIEKKISTIIEIIEKLREEKASLQEELNSKIAETEQLRQKANELSVEKDEVKRSIENLLSKLEVIEL
jgi:FtsZ-binding cell division protein ZapB